MANYLIETSHKVGVRDAIRFSTEVHKATYDEDRRRWKLEIADSDGRVTCVEVAALISAVGQLNQPNYPSIPGIGSFTGPSWHTAGGTTTCHWPASASR